ncbi:MAG: lipoyl synthase [Candidatus Azobacteroides sp.]|nr:lipoyl synthase [Candidatus Azobacteroides sp.]
MERKPTWLKIRLGNNRDFARTKKIVDTYHLHTICRSGKCPNAGECWNRGIATFMIAGDICTRSCKFCNTKTGKPLPLDENEPERIAESIRLMKLSYAVITSVDRDDLPDLGVKHWVKTIRKIKEVTPHVKIEVLIPDFQGNTNLLDQITEESPHIIGHNLETIERLTPFIRSAATYQTSMKILSYISKKNISTKTSIMIGLGETQKEILSFMDDVIETGCTTLTIGQYLQPTKSHLPVKEYIHPDIFAFYKEQALQKGFLRVESNPMVRSSYHADC